MFFKLLLVFFLLFIHNIVARKYIHKSFKNVILSTKYLFLNLKLKYFEEGNILKLKFFYNTMISALSHACGAGPQSRFSSDKSKKMT